MTDPLQHFVFCLFILFAMFSSQSAKPQQVNS